MKAHTTMFFAVLFWLGLALLPGLAILRIARVRWGFWALVASAPAVGFGGLYLVGLIASGLAIPVVWAVIASAGCLLLCWAVLEVLRYRTARRFDAAPSSLRRMLENRFVGRTKDDFAAWTLVGIAVAFGLIAWTVTQSGMAFPAGWDSMHHGYFIRQIMEYQTLDSSTVLSSAPDSHDGGSSFYPLAFNLVAAAIAQVSSIPVSQVILASTIAIGALFPPLTVFAFARIMAPNRPLVAGMAALISAFWLTPYAIIESGRVNAVLGLAVALGAAVVLLSAGQTPQWRLFWVPVLSVVGLTGLHTSELPIAILAAGVVALTMWAKRGQFRRFGTWLAWGAGATVAGLATLLILEPAILGAIGQRGVAIIASSNPVELKTALVTFAALGYENGVGYRWLPVLGTLVLAGTLVPIFVRKWRPYLAASVIYLVFGALFIGLLTRSLGPLTVLTAPWYQDFNRLAWSHAVLGSIPAAVALSAAFALLGRLTIARRKRPLALEGSGRFLTPLGIGLSTFVLLFIFALPGVASANQTIRTISTPASDDSRLVFEYLEEHIEPQSVVMDDLRMSGSLWMYSDYAVKPLFGNSPYHGNAPESWKERLWLRSHLADIDSDPCVGALLEKYNVAYIYVDPAKIWDAVPQFTKELLDRREQFVPYFASGDVAVYEVELGSDAYSCDRDVTNGVSWD